MHNILVYSSSQLISAMDDIFPKIVRLMRKISHCYEDGISCAKYLKRRDYKIYMYKGPQESLEVKIKPVYTVNLYGNGMIEGVYNSMNMKLRFEFVPKNRMPWRN